MHSISFILKHVCTVLAQSFIHTGKQFSFSLAEIECEVLCICLVHWKQKIDLDMFSS